MTRRMLWFAVPEGIDDPARVSGGNLFDLRVADGLRALGWDVRLRPCGADATLADVLASAPPGAVVLVDSLVAVRWPDPLAAGAVAGTTQSGARVAVLAHMVVAAFEGADGADVEAERRALAHADLVLATSAWARDELIARGLVPAARVVVAPPGADGALVEARTSDGTSLLCVGVVAPHKGQDLLVDALAAARGAWTCTVAGSVAVDPGFAERVLARADAAGISDRITWAGVVGRRALEALYASTDLLVAPSRTESYGMAAAEALRRGIPVLASRVGGLPEAVGPAGGILVPPTAEGLGTALHRWMTDPALRDALTRDARREAPRRPTWHDTAAAVDAALRGRT